jgi:hypothetical protein
MNARTATAQGLAVITEHELAPPRPYHTLVELQPALGTWLICFGDYEREVVDDERAEYVDAALCECDYQRSRSAIRKEYKIIRTATDDQPAISAAIQALNARTEPVAMNGGAAW